MGLFKRNNIWWMSLTYQGRQVRRSTETSDKKLAEAILGKLRVKIVEGRFFDVSEEKDRTFNELMDRYLLEKAVTKAATSSQRDEQCLAHLRPVFGTLRLVEVTPKLLATYKAQDRQQAKPATVNKELALVRHAFNVAMREWEWCRDNPMRRVSLEKVRNERDRWLSPEEEIRLLRHAVPWLQDIPVFALNTGMRRGEILGLEWRAIDLHREVLVVMIYSGLKKAGITDFRYHDLRHTFATRLAQAGVDLYKVQRLLGHKSASMTQRYAHHSPESLREGVLTLERHHPSSLSQIYHNGAVDHDQRLVSIGAGKGI